MILPFTVSYGCGAVLTRLDGPARKLLTGHLPVVVAVDVVRQLAWYGGVPVVHMHEILTLTLLSGESSANLSFSSPLAQVPFEESKETSMISLNRAFKIGTTKMSEAFPASHSSPLVWYDHVVVKVAEEDDPVDA